MKIIIINGSASTGKDKFVKLFKQKFNELRVKNISSIDKVKSIAEIAFGWEGKKDDKSRKFLSDLKRCWSEFNDGPTEYVINKIEIDKNYCLKKEKDIEKNVYFLHIREPEEIKKIKDKYGDKCISLIIKKDTKDIPDNYSDKNVDNYEYDFTVKNNGDINDLIIEVNKFYIDLIKHFEKYKK